MTIGVGEGDQLVPKPVKELTGWDTARISLFRGEGYVFGPALTVVPPDARTSDVEVPNGQSSVNVSMREVRDACETLGKGFRVRRHPEGKGGHGGSKRHKGVERKGK